MNPVVSMIIPCHNSTDYLEECWDSIRSQTFGLTRMQVIFVDDASSDDGATLRMLERFRSQAPEQVQILPLPENIRQGGARNAALPLVKGKYLQFLDSDDTLEMTAIEHLYTLAEENTADLIHYYTLSLEEDFLMTISSEQQRRTFLASHIYSCGHSSKFYSVALLRRSGVHFAEHLIYEEPLFVYPQYFYANRILFLKEAPYRARLHPKSTMASLSASRIMDHPKVQLQLLNFLKVQGLMDVYHDEIEEYFLWSFFYETIHSMLQLIRAGSQADPQDLAWLRNTALRECPHWEQNPYIRTFPTDALNILDMLK